MGFVLVQMGEKLSFISPPFFKLIFYSNTKLKMEIVLQKIVFVNTEYECKFVGFIKVSVFRYFCLVAKIGDILKCPPTLKILNGGRSGGHDRGINSKFSGISFFRMAAIRSLPFTMKALIINFFNTTT